MTRAQWYTRFALQVREDHLTNCKGRDACGISLMGLLEMAEAAGATFTNEQRKLFGMAHPLIANPSHLGQQGMEQFEVAVRNQKKIISRQAIHDPFIRTHIEHKYSRWRHLLGIFRPQTAHFWVSVSGSLGAERAIMTMDPHSLASDTEQILVERQIQRETNAADGIVGYEATQIGTDT